VRVALLLTQDRGGPVDLSVGLALQLAAGPDPVEVLLLGPEPVSSAGDHRPFWHRAEVSSKADLAGARSLAGLVASLGPDVVHAQDRRASLVAAGLLARGRRRPPLAYTYHGVPDVAAGAWVASGPLAGRRAGLAGWSRVVADAAVARRLDATVAPSQAMAAYLARRLRLPAGRLRVIANGVDLPPEPPPPRPRAEEFVAVGSFAPCKGMPLLLQAFATLARRMPRVRLRLVGDGEEVARCRQLVADCGLEGRVEFLGYRTDARDQLARADAFVLPSYNENLPLALLEAMAAGRACVASAVGGVPEALHPACGLLVSPGSLIELVGAMDRLASEDGLAPALGRAARERVASRFSIEACARSYLGLWRQLAG